MEELKLDLEEMQEVEDNLKQIIELTEDNIQDLELFFELYQEENETSAVAKLEEVIESIKDALTTYNEANQAIIDEQKNYIDELEEILGWKYIKNKPINIDYEEIKKVADNLPEMEMHLRRDEETCSETDQEELNKIKKNTKIMEDVEDELARVKLKVNEYIAEIKEEIVPEFEQIEEYEENMNLNYIEDLFDEYEELELQALETYNANLTPLQKSEIANKINNLDKDSIYNYLADAEFNEENIKTNLKLYFGMDEKAAKQLIQFYKDLVQSDLPKEDISKYFWGIQSSMVDKYKPDPFLLVNGDYRRYNDKFDKKYHELHDFLKDGNTGLAFDYPHLTATMSGDAHWNGENNNFIADGANWGMGDGGDSISARLSGNPGLFGILDKNSDSLANELENPPNSSEAFLLLLSNDGLNEESMANILQFTQKNDGRYQ